MFDFFKRLTKKYDYSPKEAPYPKVYGCENLNNSMNWQRRRVMDLLMEGQHLTSLGMAKEYSETRLAARVYELRHYHGLKIQGYWPPSEGGKRYKKYYFNINEVVR